MTQHASVSHSRPLTKPLFAAGLQCAKRLYLDYHHPDRAPELSPDRAALIEVGLELLELARQAFPASRRVDADDIEAAIVETKAVLDEGKPVAVFDAAFRHDGVEVRTDIVLPHPSGGVDIFEVKSGTKVKTRHIKDLALQVYAIEANGYKVNGATVLHLDTRYRHKGGSTYPVHSLIKNVDVTEKVRKQIERVKDQVARFQRVLDDDMTLELPTGTWCHTPFRCGYLPACRAEGTEHPLIDLPDLTRELETELHQQGIEDLTEIPPEQANLSPIQRRALQATTAGELVIEPFVGRELRDVDYPLHFVDVGTLLQVLPTFAKCGAWCHIPFQWTDLVVHEDGRREVTSFVTDGKDDPRPEFARALAAAIDGSGTLMVYGPIVELRLREVLEQLSSDKSGVRAILNMARFDLQQLVRAGVYHPDFRGSFDIMHVYRTLLDGAGRDDLEIGDSGQAAAAYRRLLNSRTRTATREKLGEQLEAYGTRCAEAIQAIYTTLRERTAD